MDDTVHEYRYFVSYSGVKLPFNLVNAIAAEALSKSQYIYPRLLQ